MSQQFGTNRGQSELRAKQRARSGARTAPAKLSDEDANREGTRSDTDE